MLRSVLTDWFLISHADIIVYAYVRYRFTNNQLLIGCITQDCGVALCA